jgi:hypothetical protein
MSLVSVLGCGTWFFPIEEQLYFFYNWFHSFFRPAQELKRINNGRTRRCRDELNASLLEFEAGSLDEIS